MTDRNKIDEMKLRLRRQAAAAAEAKAVMDQAQFENAYEDVYGKNPNDPILALVLTLLRDGNMEKALQVLADNLGPDQFFDVMARVTGQSSERQPVQAVPAASQQPAQLPSGHSSTPLEGVVVSNPEYLDVYDENGHKQNWAIHRDTPEAQVNAQGYTRILVSGKPAYQKRANVPAQPVQTGPTGTREQPAATGSIWRRRPGR